MRHPLVPAAMPGRRRLAAAGLLLTICIWGTTFVATKAVLRQVPPFTLTLLRFLLATAALLPLAGRERRRGPGGPLPWRALALAGLVGGCLFFALQNLGLVHTTASKASLIMAAIPAFTAALSALTLGERIGWVRAAGVAASVLGVATIVGVGPAAWRGGALVGDLLIVATALAWAAYTVLGKGLQARVAPALLSTGTVGLGALFLLPFAGYEALSHPLTMPTPAGWLAIGYLGLVASTLPFLLWNWALRYLDASEAAVYTNLVPLVAVASAVVLLGERLAPLQVAGGALVLVGVWAAGKR